MGWLGLEKPNLRLNIKRVNSKEQPYRPLTLMKKQQKKQKKPSWI